VTGFVNSSFPNTMSSVHMALAYLIDPRTPKNSGSFRVVTVLTKPGTVVHPNPPAPVTLSTNHCAQEIMEAMVKALAPACPDRALAGWGRRFRIAIKGVNPRTKRPFIWHMFHARPGGGATAVGDGWETAGEGQAAGGIKFGSVEVAEARFPLTFEHHEFRADSAGDGRHRGGVGATLRLRVDVTEPAVANTAGDGVRHTPYGLFGGGDGQPHRYRLLSKGKPARVLKTKEVGVAVRPGDVFFVESSGGGGYGPAAKRSEAARASDVANGFVSPRRRRRRVPSARLDAQPTTLPPTSTRTTDRSSTRATLRA
jgi:N-methylhydantoinase B